MISVLLQCYSKEDMLDLCFPTWLTQEGVDYEIVLGVGPDIKIPQVPNRDNFKGITIVQLPDFKYCRNYNMILAAAKGETLLITYCDMQINNPLQLKVMYDNWTEFTIVTDRVFRNGKRNYGTYLDLTMVSREQVMKVGGWCELYDNPDSYAHEDGDMIASLLENCLTFKFLETEESKAVYHICHPAPNMNEPVMQARHKMGKAIFFSRHKEGIMALYAKQILGRRLQRI
ncbi:MAG: hypothetical protein WC648_05190 [Candidatus Paceibacterota bacterium]|jgi:hypothetical protein